MSLKPLEGSFNFERQLLFSYLKDDNLVNIILVNLESLNGRDFDYESKNKIYSIDYEENHIKCRNHDICNESLPIFWWGIKGKYLCTNCDIILLSGYGKL